MKRYPVTSNSLGFITGVEGNVDDAGNLVITPLGMNDYIIYI